jgi:hypothetical protein
MIIWCGDIDTKEDFLEDFDNQIIIFIVKHGFFLLSPLFIERNNLDVHFKNKKSPYGKL